MQGHVVYIARSCDMFRSCGVAVRSRWAHAIDSICNVKSFCCLDMFVKRGNSSIRLISVYLPSSPPGIEAFDMALHCLAGCRRPTGTCIVGIIANAQVGMQMQYDSLDEYAEDPAHVIGEHGLGVRDAQGALFLAWCTDQALALANTMARGEQLHTHKHWATHTCKVIDYILIPTRLRSCILKVYVHPSLQCRSEHFALMAHLRPQREQPKARTRSFKLRKPVGWRVGCPLMYEELCKNLNT